MKKIAAMVVAATLAWAGCSPKPPPVEEQMKASKEPEGVCSEEGYKQKLSPQQYRILRQRGTEAPGTGNLLHTTAKGTYKCGACGQALFTSETKYEACDWPSFFDAIQGAVALKPDGGASEAVCSKCDSHLGHLFHDGPKPTGLRY
jgi:peptide-methionine (R)-S-oxide reductase